MRTPTRKYKFQGSARTLTVPRHIVRCDSMTNGHVHSRGWQVRYPNGKVRSKYFSDRADPPQKSLERAKAYLRSIYRGPLSGGGLHTREAARKKMRTGVPGIRYVSKVSRGKHVAEYYVEVGAIPSLGTGPKRFYVGTANTITVKRFQIARQKAVQFRRQLAEQVKQRA
jgi:hypothetical protein